MRAESKKIEYLSLSLLFACYFLWGMLIMLHASLPVWLLLPLLTVVLSFHGSLQHEVIHYHPTPSQSLNEALASAPLVLYLPFVIYRDTHRQHHVLENISYPSKDPESYYMTSEHWQVLPQWLQRLYTWNNTLLGRIFIGPALCVSGFLQVEFRKLKAGDEYTLQAWLAYLPWLVLVLICLFYWQFPLWIYALACYFSISLTSIRIFAEHQAVNKPTERTIVVESNGFLSYLFLQNNLHSVHHKYPSMPWYELRQTYQQERESILQENGFYVFKSYLELFKYYAWKPKEGVVHPL